MYRRFLNNLIVIAIATLPLPLLAAQDKKPASLLQIYNSALANDPTLSAAHASYQAQHEKTSQGRAKLLPVIKFNAHGEQVSQNIDNSLTPPAITGYEFSRSGYLLSAVQPLYRRQNFAYYQHTKIESQAADDQFGFAQLDLMSRVINAYFDVLIAQSTLTSVQAQQTALTDLLSQVKAAFNAGQAMAVDVNEVQASYAMTRISVISATNDLAAKKQVLTTITGSTPSQLAGIELDQEVPPLQPNNLAYWEKAALENAPAIRLSQKGLLMAQNEIQQYKAGHYPTLDLALQYGTDTIDASNFNSTTDEASLGLQLEIPLFSGGETSSLVRESVANGKMAEYKLHEIINQQLYQVNQAFIAVNNDDLMIQNAKLAYQANQSRLTSTRQGVSAGIRNSADVLNAQLELTESQRIMVTAKCSYLANLLRLKAATGMLALADLEKIDRLLTK
ncbi:MAG: TolC family outer membrane protein [Gammaproteobacteria bacterium]|nr:TolC family outer membrane protein [Gammaproteobacteria bacterium]